MSTLRIVVHDTPAPQGSKRHVGNGRMIESSKKVGPWREAVRQSALGTEARFPIGPVGVRVVFVLRRPRSHYGTGRNANTLKPSAPQLVATRPDIDKLLRSTLDGLTAAAVWTDDAQVARVTMSKVYEMSECPSEHLATGAVITVEAVG